MEDDLKTSPLLKFTLLLSAKQTDFQLSVGIGFPEPISLSFRIPMRVREGRGRKEFPFVGRKCAFNRHLVYQESFLR